MKRFVRLLPLLVVPLFGACEFSEVVGPAPADDLESFVQTLDVQSFQSLVVQSASQVEVTLLPGGLTASELSLRPSGQSPEERIQSRAVNYSVNGAAGSLTLALGGLVVTFDENTRFFFGSDEIDVLTFMSQITGNLDEGFDLPVVAERAIPAVAQDPDDGTFLADAIAIESDGSPQLRIEVDADNVEMATDPQPGEPDGFLNVLGIQIQLRVSDGTTELEQEDHDFEVIEDFESKVSTVEVDEMLVTLMDGSTVRIADRTEIVQSDELLGALTAVAEAVAQGQEVLAWGRGAVDSGDPLVLIAIKISFLAMDEEEPMVEEFEGVVDGVSMDAGTFTLTDGTVVRITDGTEVVAYNDMSPNSLGGIVEKLEAGYEVVAWGTGTVEGEEPLMLEGVRVVLKAREMEHPAEDFEGEVVEADAAEGQLLLANGWTVVVTDDTEVVKYNEQSPGSVADVVAALEGGLTVLTWGHGAVESEEPVMIVASRVVLKSYEPEPTNQVQDYVAQIDVEGMTLMLEDGTTVVVTEETEIVAYHDFSPVSLQEAMEDLDMWRIVWAKATGEVESENPLVLVANHLILKTVVEDFEKDVESIDLQSGDIVLEGGWILHTGDNTVFAAGDDGSPMTLEGAKEALDAGDRIRVWGFGYVVCLDPFSIEVVEVTILRIPQG